MLTQEQLRDTLHYSSETGVFVRIKRDAKGYGFRSDLVGQPAGRLHHSGYRMVNVRGREYLCHRLAWLYVHGEWPSTDLDHVNGDKGDNRIANLRLVDESKNGANRPLNRNSTTGFKGVRRTREGKFLAVLVFQGERRRLGIFETAEEAHAAYLEAAKCHFGEFARAN